MTARVAWPPVLDHARAIIAEYATGVTLRQLYYRLVADHTLPNLQPYYRRLSDRTAEARRHGEFPDLLDATSRIERRATYDGPDDALAELRYAYRRDRTEGQPWTIVLGVEKAGMSAQLDAWFTDPWGIPHVALGGYASQTLCDHVNRYILSRGSDEQFAARGQRPPPALLVYAGDLDPTGEDIDRDFVARVDAFDKVVRVALNDEQVEKYGLAENPHPEVAAKLKRDPRAAAFERRHGSLMQFEVDALPPDTLRDLYRSAVEQVWDDDAYRASLTREADDRRQL